MEEADANNLELHEARWNNFVANHKELEQKSLAILQASPDTISILNPQGEILYYHLGSDRENIRNNLENVDHLRSFLPEDELDEALKVIKNVIQDGQIQVREYTIAVKSGEKLTSRYSISPLSEDSVLIVSRDITKQKQLEEALRHNETLYRSLIDNQSDLISRFMPEGTITFINKAGMRLLGLPAEAIIGQNIFTFVPEAGKAIAQGAPTYADLLNLQNPSISEEMRVTQADGSIRIIQAVTQAFINEHGEAVEYQTIGRDITDLKHYQEELRESEARYRSVVNAQTEFICRFNRQGIVTFIDEAAYRIFKRGGQEIIGHNISEYLGKLDPQGDQQAISATYNLTPEMPTLSTEIRLAPELERPNSPELVLEVTTTAIFDEQGEAVEYQTTGRNITAMKNALKIQDQQNALLLRLGEQLINIQEMERQRIALELHDAVLNELGAMLIAPSDKLTPKLVRENYSKLIRQLRQTINGLRSPMLNFGLFTALDDLYDTLMENPFVEGILTFDVPYSQYRFDPNIELHLFRIIQQACDNAIQHAHPKHIRVFGLIEAEWVDITIKDDGIGFEQDVENDLAHLLAHKHFGLISMVERGKLIGAEVKITSQPGNGTQVRVFWDATKSRHSTGEVQ